MYLIALYDTVKLSLKSCLYTSVCIHYTNPFCVEYDVELMATNDGNGRAQRVSSAWQREIDEECSHFDLLVI